MCTPLGVPSCLSFPSSLSSSEEDETDMAKIKKQQPTSTPQSAPRLRLQTAVIAYRRRKRLSQPESQSQHPKHKSRNCAPQKYLDFFSDSDDQSSHSSSTTVPSPEPPSPLPSSSIRQLVKEIQAEQVKSFKTRWGYDVSTAEPIQHSSWTQLKDT